MQNTQIPKKLLIAPLDWGLGHTTRCIPLIRYLSQKNCQIFLAGNEQQFAVLRPEFPELHFIPLEGYNIRYPLNYKRFKGKLLSQIPGLLKTITREHRWLQENLKKYQWDAVISDNRFGLWHPETHCVFITHQLRIKSGAGNFVDRLIQKFNYRFIKKFNECWIPDVKGTDSLGQELSHPKVLPGNEKYIGWLSRFEDIPVEKSCDLLIMISGPEPQRTIFENIVLEQIVSITGKRIILRGKPLEKLNMPAIKDITILNHLPADELQKLISGADLILCRSGYTTLMDLIHLGKKALLVPTPGQTEQEYLASHLLKRSRFYSVSQYHLHLAEDLKKAVEFNSPGTPETNFELFHKTIDDLMNKI